HVGVNGEHHTKRKRAPLVSVVSPSPLWLPGEMISRSFFLPLAVFLALATPACADPLATAMRSVVSVLPEWPQGQRNNDEPEGSGIVIADGSGAFVVLTAWHVVSKARSIRVRTSDGDVVTAQIAGKDPATDLALLRLDGSASLDLSPFKLDDESLALGTPVCTIGNAFGLGLSVTCGVVSGTQRTGVGFNPVEDFVQTDAAVNPGASGGALVTRNGRLAGMLSAIFTKQSDANIGVNFAVSVPLIKRVVEELLMNGRVTRVLSGLQLGRAVGRLGTGRMAARVVRVRPGSPAALAGIKPGDAIFQAGGRRIRKPADFRSVMNRARPPFDLRVKLVRGARKLSPVLKIPATDWSKAKQ
ncbi:MAG: S1C family serine protease, partial [Hyphomicrobiaceae bacterium]